MQSDRETLSIAVVGHKGAGKTALIAAMAYVAQATPRLGKAGDYALGLDDTPEEKAHQSTFETHLVNLSWMCARLQLLDTPGEVGFFADTQLAFLAADSVLLVVSARAGVEATTQRLVRLILESNKPCFIAVTRCDEAQIRVEEVVQELRALKEPITLVEVPHHRSKNAALDGVVSVTSMKAWLEHPEGPSHTAPDPIPGDVAEEVRGRATLVRSVEVRGRGGAPRWKWRSGVRRSQTCDADLAAEEPKEREALFLHQIGPAQFLSVE